MRHEEWCTGCSSWVLKFVPQILSTLYLKCTVKTFNAKNFRQKHEFFLALSTLQQSEHTSIINQTAFINLSLLSILRIQKTMYMYTLYIHEQV